MSRWLLASLCLLLAPAASAHSVSTAQLDLELASDGTIAVDLDVALRDLELSLGLDSNRDGNITWGELLARRTDVQALASQGLAISAGGHACPFEPGTLRVRRYADGMYASLEGVGRCAEPSRALTIEYSLLLDQDPSHRALVQFRSGGNTQLGIANATARRLEFHPGASTAGFGGFLAEGVHHILIGYDHLAFLLSLLLPVALVHRGGWERETRLRTALLRAAALVTAFTVAHSITLTLAVLGWVAPAPRAVEIAIAASVVVAALNNVWPVVTRRQWLLAGIFGLVHGFGFAGALSELGMPRESRALALLGFNLGVEAGQLAVVGLVLPLLYLASRWRGYARAVMAPASLFVALLGAWWMFERLR